MEVKAADGNRNGSVAGSNALLCPVGFVELVIVRTRSLQSGHAIFAYSRQRGVEGRFERTESEQK
jgi:hypothetical protein